MSMISERAHTNGHRNPIAQAIQSGHDFITSECLASLCSLPGVVLYQRLVTTDGQIRYTYISEGAKDLFGVPADEILSNPDALFSTHGPEYRAKFRERLLNASRAMSVWDVEASLVTQDGRKKYT